MIQTIHIENFKSFGDSTLNLAPLTVFVGPNAAGKSNLIDAFRFVQDCMSDGIGMAATRRYGWSNLRCRKKKKHTVTFEISGTFSDKHLEVTAGKNELTFADPHFVYAFSFSHQDEDYRIVSEIARIHASPVIEDQKGEQREISAFQRTPSRISIKETLDPEKPSENEIDVIEVNQKRLFIGATFSSLAGAIISNDIARWRFYDPDPRQARLPTLATGNVSLSESGDTLAVILHQLQHRKPPNNGALREQFLDIMQTLVPGFENWTTEQLADGRITFRVKETGLRGTLPALLVSDGTVRLLTILAALLWSQVPLSTIFIEEPERSLHPTVMEQLVDLMRQVSGQTQIIITTHSADFVRHCRPEEVYLMDKVDGLTKCVRAGSIKHLDEFLKRFTLDELWLQGHLELGVP